MRTLTASLIASLVMAGLPCVAEQGDRTLLLTQAPAEAEVEKPARKPDIHFVPTPEAVVNEMLGMAKVQKGDIVYDLGCGDGRIVITAASKYGARGIGIDIDPQRIKEAKAAAEKAGVQTQVDFKVADIFESDFSDASVVALYLLNTINVKLRPKLLAETKPGTRIVSHAFTMGEWEPDDHRTVESKSAYYWVVPANMSGTWKVEGKGTEGVESVIVNQNFQKFTGTIRVNGKNRAIGSGRITGDQFTLTTEGGDGQPITVTGKVNGDQIEADGPGGQGKWTAKRDAATKGQIAAKP